MTRSGYGYDRQEVTVEEEERQQRQHGREENGCDKRQIRDNTETAPAVDEADEDSKQQ
jgi:hypothetical protein